MRSPGNCVCATLAGLIVIDFIDMEVGRNRAQVERRLKEAMRVDRARIQLGRISAFGLMDCRASGCGRA
jgi:ribonuclease E